MVAGAAAVRELARPRPNEKARLVDWDLVRTRALRTSRQAGPTHVDITGEELGRHYDEVAASLRPWIQGALGEPLQPDRFPAFKVLDRHGWIEVNLELFQGLMDPVLKLQEMVPATALTDLGRRGLSEYLGVMLGFLSQRVLGQYDPVLMAPGIPGPTSLYLVEPNIERWESRAAVKGEPLRQWLVLHEVTHAWEFEAHPWLRDHLNGLIRQLMAHRLFNQEKPRTLEVIRALTTGARSQWQAMSQIQATMSLLEGFSNVVMRHVGRDHLEHYDEIDQEFQRRSGMRSPAERAFFKITGLDMKMQQYVQGEAFCDAVIAAGGMETLREVWSGPDSLPSLEEIRDPVRWLRRGGFRSG